MTTKISCVVPVWNSQYWLADCLDSICGQTMHDIEIICINDACTDKSGIILENYAAKDPRIKIITLSQNQGEGVARNLAMEMASGQYIGFVDSDDSITPCFFQELYNTAIQTGADITRGCIREYCFDKTIALRNDILDSIKKDKSYFLYGFFSAIYNTSFLKKWKINFGKYISRSADMAFLLRAVAASNFVAVNEKAIYNYCRRENSADSIQLTLKKIVDPFKAYDIVIQFLHENCFFDIIYNIQLAYMISSCIEAARRAIPNEKTLATKLCATKILEIYNLCKNKNEFDSFIKRKLSIHSDVYNILHYLKTNDTKKIEMHILLPGLSKKIQNIKYHISSSKRG